jgi:uncharacterized membrane protein YraQ (UPF0718 family)
LASFAAMLPVLLGMLLLISLLLTLFPDVITARMFGRGTLLDTLLGAALGSLAVGQPIISYILGGELLSTGVGLAAVTALLVSWITVGVLHLPAEALLVGWRFALLRNGLAFMAAVLLGLLLPLTLGLFA